jgi:polynucleotide 5'-kinase involved in rRNA processing
VSVGKQGETLFVVYRGRYDKNGIEPIKSLCRVSGLILRDVDYFLNHLVGLVDGSGRHRALGIVEDIDYSDDKMSVFSPIDPRVPIGCVIFGKHKITRDGYQIE